MLSDQQRAALEAWATDEADPHRARRARIVLAAADGWSNRRIAADLGVDPSTVGLWRRRFAEDGLDGVAKIKEGRGRKPSLSTDTIRTILAASHQPPPAGQARWTVRAMAEHAGVSLDTVRRVWQAHGIRPAESADEDE